MATDDQQRLVTGVASAPANFTVPGNGQIRPKAIFAHYDGSGAGGSYVPALKVTSDGGKLVGIYPVGSTTAAGVSADVSWFPRVAAASGGIQYDVNNTGDWLSVEASGAGGTEGVAVAFIVDGNGGLNLTDNGNGGLNLTDHGSGGVQLSADRPGILNLFGNDTRIKLETVGATEPNILLESIGGIVLQDNNLVGDGGITLEVRPGSFITMATLPIADPGVSGAVWNNGGVLNISP